ncbi:hypothetical protein WICMUC_005595 [Wickerhamomyces mucosus]|uniref:Cation/H+ exchanger transmembrane domain-containing protein n=1 Tax=Wickerhamomyces mucosus TaxID=1378264 RepID=A0A9P8P7P5_9ASCO|nr:hypothetical protein WICMUC_005595 [Wickerhamomyces mucosus]
MKIHWVSIVILLGPVMIWGFLIIGFFIWLVIPGLNFPQSLVISGCITATDPVLCAAVVGKGKFASKLPEHIRNILSAESASNDGMALPFVYLGLNLVLKTGQNNEIAKDFICISILYECILGCLIGIFIGYSARHSVLYVSKKKLIDKESFIALYIFLSIVCAGIGSMIGCDDLLMSFAAGCAFSWNGWFIDATEPIHIVGIVDLILNLIYFLYFGAIIPWNQFNDPEIGTDIWRLIVISLVVLILRRLPIILALKSSIPAIKTWKEALFCGHFGPVGVAAIFAAITARSNLEGNIVQTSTPLKSLPSKDSQNYQLMASIWPIATFNVLASIIVHGSSVTLMMLFKYLKEQKFKTKDLPTSVSSIESIQLPHLSNSTDNSKEKKTENILEH